MKPVKNRIMGLDISSVCVGYGIFDKNKLHSYGKHLQEGKSHGEKLYNFYNWLSSHIESSRPEKVVVELPHGGIPGNATKILFQYLSVVLMVHYRLYQTEIPSEQCLYPNQVKAALEVESAGNHDKNKQIMVDRINHLFSLSLLCNPTDTTKLKTDDDIADGIAVAYAYIRRKRVDGGKRTSNPNRRGKYAGKSQRD